MKKLLLLLVSQPENLTLKAVNLALKIRNLFNTKKLSSSDHTQTTSARHSSSTGPGCVTTRHCCVISQQAFSTHPWLPAAIQCLLKNTEYNKEQQWIHTPIHVLRVNFHVITSYCSISWQRVLSHLCHGLRWESGICSLQYLNTTLIFFKGLYLLYWGLFIKQLKPTAKRQVWPVTWSQWHCPRYTDENTCLSAPKQVLVVVGTNTYGKQLKLSYTFTLYNPSTQYF